MQSFKSWLNEASEVNSHMTHLSDLLFIEGIAGTKKAVDYLRDMRKIFSKSSRNVYSVKWDGAPSVILGIDPADGVFFVAKKGIFNKNPKVYKTQADIDSELSGELRDKFSTLLKYGVELGITSGIYQGDLMYTSDDLETETIDGEAMVKFHPNTIAYAVPKTSNLAKKILKSKLGIVFHTTYTGDSFANLKANFGKNIVTKFKTTPNVWAIDATLTDDTAEFTLSAGEYLTVELLLKEIGQQFQKLDSKLVNNISTHPELSSLVLIYINSLVRKNNKSITPMQMATGFHDFIHARYQKEIDSKKTEKSKSALETKRIEALKYFEEYSTVKIATMFELTQSIEALKDLMLDKMKVINGLSHYLKTKDGYKVTNPEGFVAINGDKAIKLVDRFTFSLANFSPEIQKGWQK
jgi:hypothetical protein